MFACVSVEQQDAMNHSSFEDEEAQIQAVFKEAIRLKRRNKDLVEVNRNNESYLTHKLKELEDIVTRVLSNQDEVKRISEQLTSQKILSFFKENVNLKAKKLSYEKFVKEVYGA